MVRSQASGWALLGSGWSLEFKDRQRRLRVPGFPFAPCRRAPRRREEGCTLPRWLSDVTLGRIVEMPSGTLARDDGWITESINRGAGIWQ